MSSKRPSTCGANHVALVAAGERRDENLRSRRDAQMIGPERDEPLDERPIAGHPRGQRGMDFGVGHLDHASPRLAALLLVALAGHPHAAKGLADRRRRHTAAAGRATGRRHRAGRAASSVRPRSAGARRDERRARIDSAREVSRPFVTPSSDCLSLRRWPGRPELARHGFVTIWRSGRDRVKALDPRSPMPDLRFARQDVARRAARRAPAFDRALAMRARST